MSAFRSIDHGAAPCGIRLVGKIANDSASPPSDGDERGLPTGVEPVHLGVCREPRIEVDPRGVRAQDRPAELDELEQLPRRLVTNDGRVRVAQEPGFHGLGEEGEDAGDGLATHRDVVVFQAVVLAAMRDRVEVQAERVGPGIESRQQAGDPSGEQALLILPDRPVRVVGGEGRLRQDVQAREEPQGLVEIEVADVTPPFLVDQFQGQQAQQGRGGRDHAGAGVTRLPDQVVEAQLGQERPEDEDARDTGLQRRRHLLERAGSDVGNGGALTVGASGRHRCATAYRPSAPEKGGRGIRTRSRSGTDGPVAACCRGYSRICQRRHSAGAHRRRSARNASY